MKHLFKFIIIAALMMSAVPRSEAIVIPLSDYTANSAPAAGDLLFSVDVSDTTMSAAGTTKKLTISALSTYYAGLAITELNKTLTAPVITGGTATELTSFSLRSTGAAFDLIMGSTEAITVDRTVEWIVNDADRLIDLSGDLTFGGDFTTGGTFTTVGDFSTGGAFTTAGAVTVSGAFSLTLAISANTSLIAPTTGTLATLAGAETLTNKVISGAANTLSNIGNASLTNSSITIGGSATSLGGTVTATTILDSIGSTQGSLLYRGASAWSALTPGTAGYMLRSGGAGADPTFAEVPLPRAYISGIVIANNSGDATNDIDISAGVCRDSTNAVNITAAAMTKRLDANWSAGTGNGMRNSAAAITDTTYNIYVAMKADGTQDYYAHTSTTIATVLAALQAETGGASYLYLRYVGQIVRASSAIIPFTLDGSGMRRAYSLVTVPQDVSDATLTTARKTLTFLSIPVGRRVLVKFDTLVTHATIGTVVNVVDLTTTDAAPSLSGAPGCTHAIQGNGNTAVATLERFTNTSAQIGARSSAASTTIKLLPLGWTDDLSQ